ncbi:hypothetical protein BCR43DRAFT_447036 [Syncephalastrum racemosum]|uniref:FACT complex subunit POB3 n=1 Tax=Syncephalastrum racemosum TaxID=13706 RepID=A0A1X2H0X4_SYNRA|nr:hypothetical protein BCR43DRAFT_447036 [Syncephalastrum racemosum]
MADKHLDFDGVFCGIQPDKGRFRIAANGIGWKASSDKKKVVSPDDLRKLVWMRAARGYQLRVHLKNDEILKFDGFKTDDLEDVKEAVRKFYKLQIEVKEVSVKGWNWGRYDFQGSNLVFNVSNKPMVEFPLGQAIGSNKPSKNEVAINFVDPGQPAPEGVSPKEIDELMDVTFYVPGTVAKDTENDNEEEEEEVNADMVFYDLVKSKLELSQVTTENIVQFQEVLCLTPRGRYNIDMYQDFLRLRGKTYDYKILYNNITRLFLLLKPDDMHVLFVIGLDPPLRQGQTKYPFLVFQFVRDDEIDVELNIEESTMTEKYEDKLQKHYDAPTYEVVSTIFRGLTGRKVTIPGNYRSHHGAHALKCSMKANEGFLYPLEKSLLFLPKPPTLILHSEIGVVTFSRVGTTTGGSSRTFDMKFHMKGGNEIQISSINREEYANLQDFLKQKRIKVKTVGTEEGILSYADLEELDEDEGDESFETSRKKRRTDKAVDMDMDFAPDESGSEVAEEYDSAVEDSDNDDED